MTNTPAIPVVCVVGSANMDLITRVPRLPRIGETLSGRSFHLVVGGKGANQAVMAARLGAQVTMVARVGNDVFGEEMLRNLASHGVDTAHVRVDKTLSSGVAPIFVDDDANNVIVIVAGANGALSPDDVDAARGALLASNVLIGQLEVPIETTTAAFRLARDAGILTILNPAPAVMLPAELLALTDICVPNETEIEILTGMQIRTLQETERAARMLLQSGMKSVIVTLGEQGVFYVDAQTTLHIPAFEVKAVDPTGAGDAFIGALAVFLSEGQTLTFALTNASAVAAMSVMRIGAQVSFPRRAEVYAFMALHPRVERRA
ncbi:MAG TPA: ribokinase [Anaerolineae bacterium]